LIGILRPGRASALPQPQDSYNGPRPSFRSHPMSGSIPQRGKARRQRRKTKNSNFALWLIGISVAVLVLVVVLVNLRNQPAGTAPLDLSAVPPAWINGKSLGNPDAPVVMQAWEDFLCPHCREWSATI